MVPETLDPGNAKAKLVGLPGALLGVPVAPALAVPAPAAFTARSKTVYVVPFTNALVELLGVVITKEVVPAVQVAVFQLDPLSVEY